MLVAPSSSTRSASACGVGQLLVELVFDFAHDLLEHVFHGEQAGHGAEFIHHQRHVRVPLAKLLEHLHQRFGFGHDERLAHDVREIETAARDGRRAWLTRRSCQRRSMSLKKTAPTICSGFSSQTGRRECWLSTMVSSTSSSDASDGDRDDLAARLHDFAHGEIVEIEHAVDHVFLQFGQVAGEPAGTDDEFEFFGRVAAAAMARFARPSSRVMPRAEPSITRDEDRHQRGRTASAPGATITARRSALSMARFLGTTSPITTWQ